MKQLQGTEDKFRSAKAENDSLHKYILELQARLLWLEVAFPDPPSGISLAGEPVDLLPLLALADAAEKEAASMGIGGAGVSENRTH